MKKNYGSEIPNMKLTFFINGEETKLHTYLKEGRITFGLNKMPIAIFTFNIKNNAFSQKEFSLSHLLQKTKETVSVLEVKIPHKGEQKLLFKGIIESFHKQLIAEQNILHIKCTDMAWRLTKLKGKPETKMSIEEIIKNCIQEYNLNLNDINIVTGKNEIIFKHPNSSLWDYIVDYLDDLGYPIAVENGEMRIIDILEEKAVKYIAEYGNNVFEYSVKTEPFQKKSLVRITCWDMENQEIVPFEAIQNVAENETHFHLNHDMFEASTLKRFVEAKLKRSNLSSFYGNVLIQGNLEASIGDYIELRRIENDMDKKPLLISGVNHYFENGTWKTEYGFGFENERNLTESFLTNEPDLLISNSTKKIYNLQIGIVEQIDDPKNRFRIKIKLPLLMPSSEGVWARLSQIQASHNSGSIFIPEIGDEVVVAFLDNNLDNPIILGALYSPAKTPPEKFANENMKKGITTKSGSKIMINDSEKSIELRNISGDKITLSDDLKGIKIQDQHGNLIQMDEQGISLKTQLFLSIQSGGAIKISSGTYIEINTSGILSLKGGGITLN